MNTYSQSEPYAPFKQSFSEASTNGFLFLVWITVILLAVVAAFVHNAAYRRKKPDVANYRWGYFLGYYLLFWPFGLTVGAMAKPGATLGSVLGLLIVSLVMFSIAGFFSIRRSLVGFIFSSILSLNPVFWVISIIYAFTGAKRVWARPAPPPLPQQAESSFIIHDQTNQHGPYPLSHIRQMFSSGAVSAEWIYWNEQTQTWNPIGEITK